MDPEVIVRALESFKPIVFTLVSTTPENVSIQKVLDTFLHDDGIKDLFYSIDARSFVADYSNVKAVGGKGKSTGGDSKRGNNVTETVKTPGMHVREEYVKIALQRELHRMSVEKAKLDALHFLQAQYVEDGMTEDEALIAAEEDTREEEEENKAQDSLQASERTPLYLCITGYPNNVENILELHSANVPLDCIFNITSKAPLTGSVGMELGERLGEKSSRKGHEPSKLPGKKGKIIEEETSQTLIAQITQRRLERRFDAYNAIDEVLLYTYEFLCDQLPPRVQDGPPIYRLSRAEKVGFMAIVDSLIQIEAKLHAFREWKQNRNVVQVPSYTGLLDPDAAALVPVEVVEEKGKKSRSSSSSSRKGAQIPQEPVAHPPTTTTEELRTMQDVAANLERYEDAKLENRLQNNRFTISSFLSCCIAQVSASTTTLRGASERAESEMLRCKEAVGRFADHLFNEIIGQYPTSAASLSSSSPSPDEAVKSVESLKEKMEGQVETSQNVNGEHKDTGELKAQLYSTIGRNLASEGVSAVETINSDSLREIVYSALKELFPNLPTDWMNEQTMKALFLGFTIFNMSPAAAFGSLWNEKNMNGWKPYSKKWGEYYVDVLLKGDGSARTQQLVYSFEGPTTFPDYIDEIQFCEAEKLFFYPPPAESDEDIPEEEEDEDEEDEEGNIIPRKKKEPEPFPFLDHVSIIQQATRRRRVFENINRHLSVPSRQEAVNHGRGARSASEEVEWMFPADGELIEVERSVVNTRQLTCRVSGGQGLDFGFLYDEYTSDGNIKESVPSNVRCFVGHFRNVRVFVEVVADNTVEAQKWAYQNAVEEAKLDAKNQLEALQLAKKSARGKDKAAALPTLSELEQKCINAIPRPISREKCPPTMQISAVLNEGNTFVSFDEVKKHLIVKKSIWVAKNLDLSIRIWRNNCIDSITLASVSHLCVHTDSIEFFSPDSQGYRVLLSSTGSYATEKDGVRLTVSSKGNCTLSNADGVFSLSSLKSSQSVDASSRRRIIQREDCVKLVLEEDQLWKVNFGTNISILISEKTECHWDIAGFPLLVTDAGRETLGVEVNRLLLSFNLPTCTASLMSQSETYRALFDLTEYRVIVNPRDEESVYIMDCAFGGLYGEVRSVDGEFAVYRVSPFGRCSEERNNLLVLPKGYLTPEPQPLMKVPELWSPSFVDTLGDTDLLPERDALHLKDREDEMAFIPNPLSTLMATKSIESDCRLKCIEKLLQAMLIPQRDLRMLSCCCISNSERTNRLEFLEPSSAALAFQLFSHLSHPLYSELFEVKSDQQNIQEYVLAIARPPSLSNIHSGKKRFPSTVADVPHIINRSVGLELLWCWLVKGSEGNFTKPYIDSFFDAIRLDMGYQNAVEWLATNLPLAQREDVLVPPFSQKNPPREIFHESSENDHKVAAVAKLKLSPDTQAARELKEDGKLNYWNTFDGEVAPYSPPIMKKDSPYPVKISSAADLRAEKQSPSVACFYPSTPLMISKAFRSDVDTGKNASTMGHLPMLQCAPAVLHFGSIKRMRCYSAMVYLTNTSTVPCRYRVTVPKSLKSIISVTYPRHFLASGLTEAVEVRISGHQPQGEMEIVILIAHEGGSESIRISWNTVVLEADVRLSPRVLCIGEAQDAFTPGTTFRFKKKHSAEDSLFEEEVESNSSDEEAANFERN